MTTYFSEQGGVGALAQSLCIVLFVFVLFCSSVLPGTIQLSMFTGVPSTSTECVGGHHDHSEVRNHVLLICRRTF